VGLFRKRQSVSAIDLRAPAKPTFEFGKPVPCPGCGSPGYLDGVNLRTRVMFQHCPTCYAKWETSEADLEMMNVS
jgi:hypothetical protein